MSSESFQIILSGWHVPPFGLLSASETIGVDSQTWPLRIGSRIGS